MKEYVVGFLFSTDRKKITLIQKLKPQWQKGFWNGVGGKMEAGETPKAAMIREFQEEAGAIITTWDRFALIRGGKVDDEFVVYVFRAFGDYMTWSKTDEQVTVFNISDLDCVPTLNNLRWLIPLALDKSTDYVVADDSQ